MIDDDLRLGGVVIISFIALAFIYNNPLFPKNFEHFTEFALLGSDGQLNNYPSNITLGEKLYLKLYLENHEGIISYYRILIKSTSNQNLNITNSPLDIPVLTSYDVFLANNNNSTIPIELYLNNDDLRIFFELYHYDVDLRKFEYREGGNTLWLNIKIMQ